MTIYSNFFLRCKNGKKYMSKFRKPGCQNQLNVIPNCSQVYFGESYKGSCCLNVQMQREYFVHRPPPPPPPPRVYQQSFLPFSLDGGYNRMIKLSIDSVEYSPIHQCTL